MTIASIIVPNWIAYDGTTVSLQGRKFIQV
jgi:hypothetical protein